MKIERKTLKEKIVDNSSPVIFYELLPPPNGKPIAVDAYIECAIDLLSHLPITIDAVNIPEIHSDEKGDGNQRKNVPKIDPVAFAKIIREKTEKKFNVVLNHSTVYHPLTEEIDWINAASHSHGSPTIILVGGSSSKINYPGPSVLEMANYIQEHCKNKDIFCGGITIQSRRSSEATQDEPFRIYKKSLAGMNFFTTQIIYDAMSIKLLLRDYDLFCKKHDIEPKRIFLSFAPISTRKDLDFLRWLGVQISKETERELFKTSLGIGWRSMKVAALLLHEILHFIREKNIVVPLGLNIEHITCHNFELSLGFIKQLGQQYNNYQCDESLSFSNTSWPQLL
ncbi:hypothetical protein [Legionella cardiaca]|uniref:Methylenetetrahydrofolate reductase (NAD(P)H) n=1 Tax=Legionella cardiaca TaxID=1071983 RepID=A0ABY8ARG7_9GAMM|nr:hypothetical protein [Legionella cardiaca]WED43133.1 hypothetical protein PXX05_14735 [Legionella cardiaca]